MEKHNNRTFYLALSLLLSLFSVLMSAGDLGAVDYFDKIREDLNSNDWQVRLSAVERLNARDEKTVNLLMEVAGTRYEYWPVKIKAMTLLGEAGNPKAVDLLLTIYNDTQLNAECPSIKSYAALALGNFKKDSRVVDALITGIHDSELLTREASIQSLGKIGNTKAVPHLILVLNDKSPAVKLSAIKALENIGDTRAIQPLEQVAANEHDAVIKSEAQTALKNFRKK